MAKASNRVKRTRGKPLEAGQDDRRQVGRPKGSVNRYTAALKDAILLSARFRVDACCCSQAIEQLAGGHAESLGEKAMELALGGDVACLRHDARSGLSFLISGSSEHFRLR